MYLIDGAASDQPIPAVVDGQDLVDVVREALGQPAVVDGGAVGVVLDGADHDRAKEVELRGQPVDVVHSGDVDVARLLVDCQVVQVCVVVSLGAD